MSETTGILETLGTIVSSLGWLNMLLTLAVAVVALVRLRMTPAGILLAIGFGAMTLCNGAGKIYGLVALDPESAAFSGDYVEQLQAITWVSSLTNILLWLVIAVGIALIPLSLRRLAKPSASGTPA